MLRRLIGEDVELVVNLDPAIGLVHRPTGGQLEQVLLNLAVNARDAMPHGGRLTIETATSSCDGARRRARASRAGPLRRAWRSPTPGSAWTRRPAAHIFEPFFTTKELGKGTGSGWRRSTAIVKQSGGQIVVDSEPAAGTTFEIYLPRARGRGGRSGGSRREAASPGGTRDDPARRGRGVACATSLGDILERGRLQRAARPADQRGARAAARTPASHRPACSPTS